MPDKIYETTVLKSLDIRQVNSMISERWKSLDKPKDYPIFLPKYSRLQGRDEELWYSLAIYLKKMEPWIWRSQGIWSLLEKVLEREDLWREIL